VSKTEGAQKKRRGVSHKREKQPRAAITERVTKKKVNGEFLQKKNLFQAKNSRTPASRRKLARGKKKTDSGGEKKVKKEKKKRTAR